MSGDAAVEVLRASVLAGVPHGFLGRRGGVSTGRFAELNVGLGEDDPERVAENRRRAAAAVVPAGPDGRRAVLATAQQVHGADCFTHVEPPPPGMRPRADALVTAHPGIALGIVTADCAPVLLADWQAGVIGAAHAGWRGALAGVTDTALMAMAGLGARAERIVAAVGPAIAQASYEVDDAVRDAFPARDHRFFASSRAGRYRFDLAGYVAHRLAAAGVGRTEVLACDTYADPDRFFSYRRSSHRGEPDGGRQFSLIALAPARPPG